MSRIKLENVSVEIPLRGLSHIRHESQRVVRKSNGEIVIHALNDISFEAGPGARVGILGANGSGKTTLLRTLAGVVPATSGHISITGEVHAIFDLSDGMRFALTGRENARLRYYLLGEPGGSEESFVQEVKEFADLGEFFDLPVNIYSPGMLSRLLLAMSTVKHADILLIDEWIGVADQAFQKKVSSRINDLIMSNDVFVLASHSRDIIERTTDHTILLEDGEITRVGKSHEIHNISS
ncbi:MAG: ABC transporter ATP-binding protein [Hyphomicrobiales bacterium]|nr:ABC transporter ATP-binding protein [Hyphomicrobiales bacterium]